MRKILATMFLLLLMMITVGTTAFATDTEELYERIGDTLHVYPPISTKDHHNCFYARNVVVHEGVTRLPQSFLQDVHDEYNAPISVSLPSSLEYIGNSAFSGQEGLTEIDLPKGVGIGAYSFANTGLTSLYLPEGVSTYNGTFQSCHQLKSVRYAGGTERVTYRIFADCEQLSEVQLCESIKHIESEAFYNCSSLTEIELPDGLESMADHAFVGTNLTEISIPSGCTMYGSMYGGYQFEGCPITKLELGSNIVIGGRTFANTQITELVIPENCHIGKEAFAGTPLTSLVISEGCEVYDEAFADTPLTEVTIYSMEYISDTAFPSGPQFTVYGYWDSSAMYSANARGNTFIPLEDSELKVEMDKNSNDYYEPMNFLAGTPSCWNIADDGCFERYIRITPRSGKFTNVELKVELPEGFSFEKNELVREKTYTIETLESEYWQEITIYPIFVEDPTEAFSLKASVSGVNQNGERAEDDCEDVFLYTGNVTDTATANSNDLGDVQWTWNLDALQQSGSYSQESAEFSALLSSLAYQPDMLKGFLDQLGFTNFERHDIGLFSQDTVGRFYATKKVIVGGELKTILIVAARGTVGAEWLGNLDIGGGNVHQGFAQAASSIMAELQFYCQKQDIGGDDLLIFGSGHSRAAAVMGLVGNWLNSAAGLCPSDNVLIYNFATPSTVRGLAAGDTGNRNIFNILHYYDVIVNAPSMAFYGRYGQVKIFGMELPAPNEVGITTAYGNFVCTGGSENYTANELLSAYMYQIDPANMSKQEITALLLDTMKKIGDHTGIGVAGMSDYVVAGHSMKAYFAYAVKGGQTYDLSAVKQRLNAAYAYYQANIEEQEQGLEWVMHFFECPIDVYVYDASGNQVAYLADGEAVSTDSRVLVSYENEGFIVALSADAAEDYNIQLAAYDNGSVTHTVYRYKDGTITGLEQAADIPVSSGQTIAVSGNGHANDGGANYQSYSDIADFEKSTGVVRPSTEEVTPGDDDTGTNKGGLPIEGILDGIAVVIAAAVIVVFIILNKKKKQQ